MHAQTYYYGDPDHANDPDLPAAVLLDDEEAQRLHEALRAARDLMTWVLTLPTATGAAFDAVFAQLRTLEEFQRAHDEAHGIGN